MLLLALGMAVPTWASDPGCGMDSQQIALHQLEAALRSSDYGWTPSGCDASSLLERAEVEGRTPQQVARQEADGLGGVTKVVGYFVTREPAFSANPRWRALTLRTPGGAALVAVREQWPEFHAGQDLARLLSSDLPADERAEAEARFVARQGQGWSGTVPNADGHPGLDAAVEALGWTNPQLTAAHVEPESRPDPVATDGGLRHVESRPLRVGTEDEDAVADETADGAEAAAPTRQAWVWWGLGGSGLLVVLGGLGVWGLRRGAGREKRG